MNVLPLKPLGLAFAISLALAACSSEQPAQTAAAPEPATPLVDLSTLTIPVSTLKVDELDTSIPACRDLNAHVNGKWLADNPVPADRTSWGSFELLAERSLEVQRAIVENAANGDPASGSVEANLGDLWATGMDEAAVNAAGIAPIQPQLDKITALANATDVAAFVRDSYVQGEAYLFGFFPESDFKNPTMNIAYAVQGGLGLPDRSYYLEDRADYVRAREAYVPHIARMLELSGTPADAAAEQALAVFAFETRLAKASKSNEEFSRDVSLYYNPVSLAEADQVSPNFLWSAFFAAQGLEGTQSFSLSNPDFHAEVSRMLEDTPVSTWQAYLRFHTISDAAPFLSDAVAQENFAFFGKTLRGQAEMKPRWKRVLDTINAQMGEALGQSYVAASFSPEAKQRMQQLVANLSTALKDRLEKLDWMSEETKARALEKWATFTPKIGYPDKWRDWSGLTTSREGYYANLRAANAFNWQWLKAKINRPIDPTEWGMSPQTVNATYNPLRNEITFPAAILQPPFFDLAADDALNYGGIGAVIGHEMIHGYDDQGSRFDAKGNFANWWTEADSSGFKARTGKLVAQFDAYESIEGLKLNGNLTLGENIADLGGLAVAYDALHAELMNKRVGEIDGLTPDQRFFMNWAVVWRRNFKPEELKVRLTTDPHAPANFRAIGAPSNLPAFAAAFGCGSGDGMVRGDATRVAIW